MAGDKKKLDLRPLSERRKKPTRDERRELGKIQREAAKEG